MYTIDRLSEDIVRDRGLEANALAESVFETVREFAAGELKDDATILVVRRTGG